MGEVVLAAEGKLRNLRCVDGYLAWWERRREEKKYIFPMICGVHWHWHWHWHWQLALWRGFASSLKKSSRSHSTTTPHHHHHSPFHLRSTPFLVQLLYSLLLATAKVNGLLASCWSACLVFDHYDCISQAQAQSQAPSQSRSHLTTSHESRTMANPLHQFR
jgi:hypothetical protein